jgi:hypothetical protein
MHDLNSLTKGEDLCNPLPMHFTHNSRTTSIISTGPEFRGSTAWMSLQPAHHITFPQILVKLIAFRLKYFTHKFEVFDGAVVIISYILDVASM